MSPATRLKLVKFILFMWPVMPRWARVWAFLNDPDLNEIRDE
jgi:hypothetical protein